MQHLALPSCLRPDAACPVRGLAPNQSVTNGGRWPTAVQSAVITVDGAPETRCQPTQVLEAFGGASFALRPSCLPIPQSGDLQPAALGRLVREPPILTRGPISRLITSSTSPTNAPRRRPIASSWPWRSAWRTLPQRLRGLQGPHASADGDVGTGSRRTSHASTPPIASTTACSTMAGHSDRVSSTIAVKKRPNRPVRMTPASPW
jgi:hypothetical protein